MDKIKIAAQLLKLAKALLTDVKTASLLVVDPHISQRSVIVDTLRRELGLAHRENPFAAQYLTVREAEHNKFIYYGIFKDRDSGEYVSGRVWGRIGRVQGAKEIVRDTDLATVRRMTEAYVNHKLNKRDENYMVDSFNQMF